MAAGPGSVINRKSVPSKVLLAIFVCASACAKRAPAEAKPGDTKPQVEVADTEPAAAPPNTVEAQLEFLRGEACTLAPVGFETPLVAVDGSEVVLLAKLETFYGDGTDVRREGLWRLAPGQSDTFGDQSPMQILDWYGLDTTDCSAARVEAGVAFEQVNAYLASQSWLAMTPIERRFFHEVDGPIPGPEQGFRCVSGTAATLCSSESRGIFAVLDDDDRALISLYIDFSSCVAVAMQEQGDDGGAVHVTTAAVFDIHEIVQALPVELHSGACGSPEDQQEPDRE